MLLDKLKSDVVVAMKEGKKDIVETLRFVISQLNYLQIDKKSPLTDEDTIDLMRKEIKKRREAIEMFLKGNRTDLADKENAQIAIILNYVPKTLSEGEISAVVENILKEMTAPYVMGAVIGKVMAKLKGRVDGSVVAKVVREKISNS